MKPTPAPAAPSLWPAFPKLRLRMELRGGGTLAQQAGADPKPREAVLEVEGAEVAKMMAAMGWDCVGPGQSGAAAEALCSAIGTMLEEAGWMSGYEYPTTPRLREALEALDPSWREAMEGTQPWRIGAAPTGAWIECKAGLSSGRVSGAAGSTPLDAAMWMAAHERGAQEFVATVIDQFGRLGATASIGWARGFGDWSQALSQAPLAWDWPKAGAALCVELEDDSSVCASLSPAGVKAWAASPLGRAFGPRASLALQACVKPLRLACGDGRAQRSYSYHGLPAPFAKEHFPCQVLAARVAWREQSATTAPEVLAALSEMFGAKGLADLSVTSAAPERMGAMRRQGIEDWLAGCAARIQAKKLARGLGSAAKGASGPSPAKPRL